MIMFLVKYRHLISNKKLDKVIEKVNSQYDDKILSIIVEDYDSFDRKARNTLLGHVQVPNLSIHDQLVSSIESMMEFWDAFAFGNEDNARDQVYGDIVRLYNKLYSKTATREDMIDLLEDFLGASWWVKSTKHKELFTLVKRFVYPMVAQEPSFL